MTRVNFITQLNALLEPNEIIYLSPIIDHLIMVMGDNLQDMAAWLTVSRQEFGNQSALELIQKEDFVPVKEALRKIMEQDSRIG
ncbi:MAG: hypothetical protein GJ671_02580 [Alteromonadaceae bacterium]|nr:hypothetical protein [Alteromonadaceae bacterium]